MLDPLLSGVPMAVSSVRDMDLKQADAQPNVRIAFHIYSTPASHC